MKRRTWLRLNVGPCSAHAYDMDRMMEKEEKNKVMEANTHHELEMMRQARKAEGPLFKDIDPISGSEWDEKRMDVIGQNGNDGEHYNRGNWWGLADDWDTEDEWENTELSEYEKVYGQDGTEANNQVWKYVGANYTGRNKEPDATGMEEDPPSAAEDCARQRGNYEI